MKTRIFQNNEGISPVLGFILILAIGVTILSTVQLSFVPVWNTQEELDHIKLMQDDFKVLKSNIESGIQSGTTLSSPLIMGFKYSPKMFVYNPSESAYASLDIQNDTWAEVRYNELFQEGMTDETSIKNISTSTITYSLKGAKNYDSFIYEHGLIRRGSSDYTTNSQTLLANDTIYLISVKPLGTETVSSVEKRIVNIYPTSQQKNSVIGKKVWLILHTKPEYVNWWRSNIEKEGGVIKKVDSNNGIIITYKDSRVIKLGETFISTTSKTAPPHALPWRLAKITPENINLPIEGTINLAVEVQDNYNNPIPNVQVNFNINTTRTPSNANATATLLQNSAVSGVDGRASIMLKTGGAGFYYIDASLTSPAYTTTFVYPASSQGEFLSLAYTASDPEFYITSTLKNGLGNLLSGENISFDSSDGNLSTSLVQTDISGNASTTLNVTNATGMKITNIQSGSVLSTSSTISWETINNIIVTAKSGYVFNSIEIPTRVNTTGCVQYGTSSGNYTSIACDSTVSYHSVSLTDLVPDAVYYYIVNSSRPGGTNVNSTEYMFVTGIPPASVTNLTNVTYYPLYINWTWNDPSDSDFDHVRVYIDGVYKSDVSKGKQSFSASYFSPNSSHVISTRTVDIEGNMNATWVNHTATTPSVFTYIFNFLLTNGTSLDSDKAKNDSDNAFAIFTEELTGGTNQSDRPLSPSITITNGTQQAGGTPGDVNVGGDGLVNITRMTMKYNTTHASANPTMTTGTISAGSYLGTLTSNNVRISLREVNAAPFPYNSDWTSWQTTNASGYISSVKISLESYSSSLTAEPVYFQTWNYTSGAYNTTWVLLGTPAITSATENILTYIITDPTLINHTISPTGAFRIRLADDSTVAPPEPGTPARTILYIDEFKVDITYFSNTLNVTYTFNESNSSALWQSISIMDSSYGDSLTNVSIFNATSNMWESLPLVTPFIGGTTLVQHVNVTKGANGNARDYDAGSGQIKIRYNWTGSIYNNSLGIDLLNVTVNYIYGGMFRLNVTSNTTGIPDNTTRQELQIRYYISNDNYTLQVWDGSAWNNRTTLNDTGISYRNLTLSSAELRPDGTLAGSSFSLNKYYVLVRYLGENPDAKGTLYLDYQRVYSS